MSQKPTEAPAVPMMFGRQAAGLLSVSRFQQNAPKMTKKRDVETSQNWGESKTPGRTVPRFCGYCSKTASAAVFPDGDALVWPSMSLYLDFLSFQGGFGENCLASFNHEATVGWMGCVGLNPESIVITHSSSSCITVRASNLTLSTDSRRFQVIELCDFRNMQANEITIREQDTQRDCPLERDGRIRYVPLYLTFYLDEFADRESGDFSFAPIALK